MIIRIIAHVQQAKCPCLILPAYEYYANLLPTILLLTGRHKNSSSLFVTAMQCLINVKNEINDRLSRNGDVLFCDRGI